MTLRARREKRKVPREEESGILANLRAIFDSKEPLSQEEFEQNLRTTGAFISFIATGALCIASYINFRTYHLALEKLDSLTSLLNNPNARVASSDQGKRILKKLGVDHEAEQQ